MLTAIDRGGRKVGAWEAERTGGPFGCQCCCREVVLRRGGIIAAHFAHKPPINCEYGSGESEEHRRCKLEIYEHLARHPRVAKCEMERNLGPVRPDISAYLDGVPFAVEVQLSALTAEKIERRTAEYCAKNIFVLWLPLYSAALARDLYNPRPWERWLHAAYFGRVYYWVRGLTVVPIHFRNYYARVRGRTRDYEKLSERKVPISGRSLDLAEDFRPLRRAAFRVGANLLIPPATLLIDTQLKNFE